MNFALNVHARHFPSAKKSPTINQIVACLCGCYLVLKQLGFLLNRFYFLRGLPVSISACLRPAVSSIPPLPWGNLPYPQRNRGPQKHPVDSIYLCPAIKMQDPCVTLWAFKKVCKMFSKEAGVYTVRCVYNNLYFHAWVAVVVSGAMKLKNFTLSFWHTSNGTVVKYF